MARTKLLVTGLGRGRVVEQAYFDVFGETKSIMVRGIQIGKRKRLLSGNDDEMIVAYAGRNAHDIFCRSIPKVKNVRYVLSLVLSDSFVPSDIAGQANEWAYAGLWERGDATRPPEFVAWKRLKITEHDYLRQLIVEVLKQGLKPTCYPSKLAA